MVQEFFEKKLFFFRKKSKIKIFCPTFLTVFLGCCVIVLPLVWLFFMLSTQIAAKKIRQNFALFMVNYLSRWDGKQPSDMYFTAQICQKCKNLCFAYSSSKIQLSQLFSTRSTEIGNHEKREILTNLFRRYFSRQLEKQPNQRQNNHARS